jgi:predicted TIM-barrel fold metal-dependent hydrolase
MTMNKRIDVHHHLAPPAYISGLPSKVKLQAAIKAWTVEQSLQDMDRGGVTQSILTVTTPGFWFGEREQTRALVRASSEYAARLAQRYPGRFGLFAMLPLPDVEGSLREIEYGLDTLGAQGIGLFTNYRDKWIGDAAFDPVFEELNRRKALVHVHPDTPDCCRNIGSPHFRDSMIEYGTDTSRAIGHVVFSGTAHRYPDIRFIWSHAGGTMPFIVQRFTREPLAKPELAERVPNGVLHELQRFHFDTAQAAHVHAMASLTKLVSASQIVFGTDFPFRSSAEHVKGLAECGCFTESDLRAIDYQNAERLLARPATAQ